MSSDLSRLTLDFSFKALNQEIILISLSQFRVRTGSYSGLVKFWTEILPSTSRHQVDLNFIGDHNSHDVPFHARSYSKEMKRVRFREREKKVCVCVCEYFQSLVILKTVTTHG